MSDEAQEAEAQETDVGETEATATDSEAEAVLDAEGVSQTSSVEELQEVVEEQQDRIKELEDLLLDLSTRVADGNAMGVCPDCHGAVIKVNPWFRSGKIKCTECERVFHEY